MAYNSPDNTAVDFEFDTATAYSSPSNTDVNFSFNTESELFVTVSDTSTVDSDVLIERLIAADAFDIDPVNINIGVKTLFTPASDSVDTGVAATSPSVTRNPASDTIDRDLIDGEIKVFKSKPILRVADTRSLLIDFERSSRTLLIDHRANTRTIDIKIRADERVLNINES